MKSLKILWVDVETTGLKSDKNGIHQLSGCIDFNGKMVDTFNYHIKPFDGCEIDEKSLAINNLKKEDLDKYPSEASAFKAFNSLLKKYVVPYDKTDRYYIAGYNVHFDKQFLYPFFERNGGVLPFLVWGNHIDVMVLATQKLLIEREKLKDFKLGTVAKYLGIQYDTTDLHNADVDIDLTRKIYYLLLKSDARLDNAKADMLAKTVVLNSPLPTKKFIKNLEYVLDFGKYKEKTIAWVIDKDPQYILWIRDNVLKVEIDKLIIAQAQEKADVADLNRRSKLEKQGDSTLDYHLQHGDESFDSYDGNF
jgi:DNA polymerase-3 subunit epsilon